LGRRAEKFRKSFGNQIARPFGSQAWWCSQHAASACGWLISVAIGKFAITGTALCVAAISQPPKARLAGPKLVK
jgi:hypothetical protein